jgi:hypothetical protein
LHGEPITQATLMGLPGDAFGTPLRYRAMDVDEYSGSALRNRQRLRGGSRSSASVVA